MVCIVAIVPEMDYICFHCVFVCLAGMCWLQQGPEHRCDMVLMRGVSREECCAASRLDTAWSNTSLPINEVSLLGFLGIVSCKPCKGTDSYLPSVLSRWTGLSHCNVDMSKSVC